MNNEPVPFPLTKVLVIGAVQLANTVSYLATAPFVAFMVLSFDGSLTAEQAGYRTGVLEASYHVGAAPGAILWGILADRYGRKPATIFGLLGTIFSAIGFGLSGDFATACIWRFAWGFLNQNIGTVKSMLSETLSDRHTARGFSMIGLNNGVGRVLAPVLGGYLSEPATKYPALFGTSALLITYPFLLPCLVCAAFVALILLMAVFVLEETLGVAKAEMAVIEQAHSAKTSSAATSGSGAEHSDGMHSSTGGANQDSDESESVSLVVRSEIRRGESARSGRGTRASSAAGVDGDVLMTPTGAALAAPPDFDELDGDSLRFNDARTKADDEEKKGPPNAPLSASARCRGFFGEAHRLLSDRAVLVSIGLYSLLGLGALVTNELQPLYFLLPPTSGGFGWDSSRIGLVSAIAGPPLIICQLFVYDKLVTRFGVMDVCRWAFALTTVCLLMQPWCSLAGPLSPNLQVAVVAAHFTIMALSRITSFTSVFVFTANSALPVDRGRVNGLSQSLVSVARAVGPPLFTPLFAWCVESKLSYPLNYHLPFLLLAALTAVTLWLTYSLPAWIVKKRTSM